MVKDELVTGIEFVDEGPRWVPLAPHERAWLRDQAALAAVRGMAHKLDLGEEWIAKRAYVIADALLAERDKAANQ